MLDGFALRIQHTGLQSDIDFGFHHSDRLRTEDITLKSYATSSQYHTISAVVTSLLKKSTVNVFSIFGTSACVRRARRQNEFHDSRLKCRGDALLHPELRLLSGTGVVNHFRHHRNRESLCEISRGAISLSRRLTNRRRDRSRAARPGALARPPHDRYGVSGVDSNPRAAVPTLCSLHFVLDHCRHQSLQRPMVQTANHRRIRLENG